MDLNLELFLLLFMVLIFFNDGVSMDKKFLWKNWKVILLLLIGLVFVIVGVLGVFIYYLIFVIFFVVVFVLVVVFVFMDVVVVGVLVEKVRVFYKIMYILEGELFINDVFGFVLF